MPELYSSETVEEIVPDIMRRQIMRLQALVIAPGIEALPAKGGWRFIPTLQMCDVENIRVYTALLCKLVCKRLHTR